MSQYNTAPAPRVPHRVIAVRGSFEEREPAAWRGHLAVTLLVAALSQMLILLGHGLWLLEVWLYHLVRH